MIFVEKSAHEAVSVIHTRAAILYRRHRTLLLATLLRHHWVGVFRRLNRLGIFRLSFPGYRKLEAGYFPNRSASNPVVKKYRYNNQNSRKMCVSKQWSSTYLRKRASFKWSMVQLPWKSERAYNHLQAARYAWHAFTPNVQQHWIGDILVWKMW